MISQLDLQVFLDRLVEFMGPARFGEWSTVGPIRDGQGQPIDIVHAAMLRTGWVMFIEAACGLPASRTPLWNPFNRAKVEIRVPVLLRTIFIVPDIRSCPTADSWPSAAAEISGILRIPTLGGRLIRWSDRWNLEFTKDAPTIGHESHVNRWYPTLVTLGDVPGRILIASDNNRMEIYEEATGTFSLVTAIGPDRAFRPRYPGLHLLPG